MKEGEEPEQNGDTLEQYALPEQVDPPLALLEDEKRQEVDNFRDIFKVHSLAHFSVNRVGMLTAPSAGTQHDKSLTDDQRHYVDEYVAYRYLKARDWNHELAEEMLR